MKYLATYNEEIILGAICCVPQALMMEAWESNLKKLQALNPMGRLCSLDELCGPAYFCYLACRSL